jgi:hypothetical protein
VLYEAAGQVLEREVVEVVEGLWICGFRRGSAGKGFSAGEPGSQCKDSSSRRCLWDRLCAIWIAIAASAGDSAVAVVFVAWVHLSSSPTLERDPDCALALPASRRQRAGKNEMPPQPARQTRTHLGKNERGLLLACHAVKEVARLLHVLPFGQEQRKVFKICHMTLWTEVSWHNPLLGERIAAGELCVSIQI